MTLSELIERKKITDSTLSKKSKVSPATISQIKSGKRKEIRLSTASKIAKALDVTVEEIYKCIRGEHECKLEQI